MPVYTNYHEDPESSGASVQTLRDCPILIRFFGCGVDRGVDCIPGLSESARFALNGRVGRATDKAHVTVLFL